MQLRLFSIHCVNRRASFIFLCVNKLFIKTLNPIFSSFGLEKKPALVRFCFFIFANANIINARSVARVAFVAQRVNGMECCRIMILPRRGWMIYAQYD